MSDADVHPLSRILEIVDIWPDERIDFSDAGDPVPQVAHLTVSAMYLNVVSVIEFGGRGGAVRQQGLVEQIVASAFQTFGGHKSAPWSV